MAIRGIDVSSYQSSTYSLDGVDFVIVKATEGRTFVDPLHGQHTAQARAAGERVTHVHLKDVDATVAARLRAGDLSLVEAVQAGVFTTLGSGDAGVARAIAELDRAGYSRWWVLEQDTATTGPEPAVGSGPMEAVRQSIGYIESLAPTEESVAS